MNETLQKPLLIYSASAGSGKTYQLVQHYLKLVLNDQYHHQKFAKILAMTFTNKAAWEMKERVIEALDLLSFIDKWEGKRQEDAENLMTSTMETTNLKREEIAKRSKYVLAGILHNYEDFNLLTIDKFSLRLIRTFSRDLDLQEDFEVTLDEDTLLEEVIDEMMSKIGQAGEEEITELAKNYAKANLDEGNQWDFRRELIGFSKVLTNERDQEFLEKLLDNDYSNNQYFELIQEIKEIENEHRKKCVEIDAYFQSLGTNEGDYPGKSRGIYAHLNKLKERNLKEAKPPSATILKTLEGENVKSEHNVDGQLMQMMSSLFEWEQQIANRYYTLSKLRGNFYNLALLKHISNELTAYKEKQNLIGIYEFGRRISELLQDENAPFIYERLGNRYEHYLLDEFQDTSRLQWLNMIPLVHESIAHNHENLIVGDPKQAIYRFRNGLVEQFVALPAVYNPERIPEIAQTSAYFEQMGVKNSLENNYRSQKEIVQFNNSFFTHLLDFMPEGFGDYYNDVKQQPKGASGGYIQIDLFEEKDKEKIQETEQEFLVKQIEQCEADGYQRGDICILTRNRKEGMRYAQFLTQKGYTIVSSDSLQVNSDLSVRLCIDYLNLRRQSHNSSLQIKFASSYFRSQEKPPVLALEKYWIDGKVGRFDFDVFVEDYFNTEGTKYEGKLTAKEYLFFSFENMYDLGQQLLQRLSINELENPYLHHLMELFQNYDLQFGPDLRGFLEEWDAKIHKSSIQMPENNEAIKIMTIHKAKGLEFPVVLLPNLSWKINVSRNTQFIESDDENKTLLYSQLASKDVPEYMEKAYRKEYHQILLDELNVLYVAFTRPSSRLYMLVNKRVPKGKTEFYSQLNYPIVQALNTWGYGGSQEKTDDSIVLGDRSKATEKEGDNDGEINFIPSNLVDKLWFPDMALRDEEAIENEQFDNEQQYGRQLHAVFEEMDRNTTISEIVQRLSAAGKIEKKNVEAIEKEASKVHDFLQKQPFYQEANQMMNEQDIIINATQTKRPDKIFINDKHATIIDFKSGEKRSKYRKQVRDYCLQLKEMNFETVEGFILYTKELELEQIAFEL